MGQASGKDLPGEKDGGPPAKAQKIIENSSPSSPKIDEPQDRANPPVANYSPFQPTHYQHWSQNAAVVTVNACNYSGWKLETSLQTLREHMASQFCLILLESSPNSNYTSNNLLEDIIWRLCSYNHGTLTPLASKQASINMFHFLNETSPCHSLYVSSFMQPNWLSKRIREYYKGIQSCSVPDTPAFLIRAHLPDNMLDPNINSEANMLEVRLALCTERKKQANLPLIFQMLMHSIASADLTPNFTFSPHILYESVRKSSKEWTTFAERPKGLADLTKSYNYQLRAVDWMIHRERAVSSSKHLKNALIEETRLLWIEIADHLYYSHSFGTIETEVSRLNQETFTEPCGGILSDEMGLGKTVEVLSLVLSNPCHQSIVEANHFQSRPTRTRPDTDPPLKEDIACFCSSNPHHLDPAIRYSSWVFCRFCSKWQHTACVAYASYDPLYACPSCGAKAIPRPKNMQPAFVDDSQAHFEGKHDLQTHGSQISSMSPNNNQRYLIELPTTLIICPDNILPQWASELKRHCVPGALRYVVYSSKNRSRIHDTPIYRAEQFRDYDIVLTTYAVLHDAMGRMTTVDGQQRRSRRNPSTLKHIVMPSPLIGAVWHRVCFDESQLLGDGAGAAAELALQLRIRHRWAVSGTPIAKNINDLFGLFKFLDAQPYSDKHYWQTHIAGPLLKGHENPLKILQQLLQRLMWRTEKQDVNEIDMPGMKEKVHVVHFSFLENYMYQQRWKYCEEKLQHVKRIQAKGALREEHFSKMVADLLTLRQACCHPQLGQHTGLKALSQGILSAPDVFKQLIAQARVQTEDKLRSRIYYLHGLAALAMAEHDYAGAAKLYRQVLDRNEFNHIDVDKTNLLHARHNLLEALRHLERDRHTTEEQLTAMKLEILDLEQEIELYRSNYISEARNRFIGCVSQYVSHTDLLQHVEETSFRRAQTVPISKNCAMDVDSVPTIESAAETPSVTTNLIGAFPTIDEALEEREINEEEASQESEDPEESGPIFLSDIPPMERVAFDYWVHREDAWWKLALDVMDEELTRGLLHVLRADYSRSGAIEEGALSSKQSLIRYLMQTLNILQGKIYDMRRGMLILCNKQASDVLEHPPEADWRELFARETCRQCQSRKLTHDAKKTKFKYREMPINQLCKWCQVSALCRKLTDSVSNFKETGYLHIFIAIGKCLMGRDKIHYSHINDNFVLEVNECLGATLRAIDIIKREISLMERVSNAYLDYCRASDELNQIVTRMTIAEEANFDEPRYMQALIDRRDIPALRMEYTAQLKSAQFEFQEQFSQLSYLQKQLESNVPATCSICWEPLPENIMLLPCGHTGCVECFKKALAVAAKCPMCRARIKPEERKIVTREASSSSSFANTAMSSNITQADFNATHWGSKIEKIVEIIQQEITKHPGEKFLVFSHWMDVLSLVKGALVEAGIHVLCPGSAPVATIMDTFRNDLNSTVLCLQLSSGSKGANLTCASQIIFVEPNLMTASEAQAIGRIHRLGQSKSMQIHRFYVADSVEQSIFELSMMRRRQLEKKAAVGFGTTERETSILDMETLENLLRGKPLNVAPEAEKETLPNRSTQTDNRMVIALDENQAQENDNNMMIW